MQHVFQFVTVTFWALYAIDRALVYPEHLDAVIPVWYNHSVVCMFRCKYDCSLICYV